MSARLHIAMAVFTLSIVSLTQSGSAASILKTQPPCTPSDTGSCTNITAATPQTVTLRSISLEVTQAGKALVNFNGSGRCVNAGAGLQEAELHGQIVLQDNDVPADTNPGGVSARLKISTGEWVPVNWAATRVVTIRRAGTQTFFFKVRRAYIEGGITCFFNNNTLSVLFLPN